VGQAALAAHEYRAGQMRMALLDVDGGGLAPFFSHPVLRGDAVIGLVTSGAYGHRTGQALALAYLRAGEMQAGDHGLAIQILDQLCPARILPGAPYDPTNERLRT
jgi:dimethylglycine dehydrogenase